MLGMHNSGTSLLGNLMHTAGIPLGPDLLLRERIPEEKRPRYDYFEDEAIVQLQDACLLDLQRHWSSYRSAFRLPERQHPAREQFRQKLAKLIPLRLQKDAMWLVKDPRSAVLVEDWLEVLKTLNVEARPLIVHRDPASNIRSFSSKGQVPALWAEALWQRTYAEALLAASTVPQGNTAFTSFDALMGKPAQEIKRLCDWLERPLSAEAETLLSSRVDRNLPTQAKDNLSGAGSVAELHPGTEALQVRLQNGVPDCAGLPTLLADELEQAANQSAAPLELNRFQREQQTLLPKVSVTLVTSELQGWGPGGGIGSAMRELAVTLRSAGHPVTVLLVQPGAAADGPALEGLAVHHLDSSGCSRLALVRRVAAWLRDHRTDVVHLHDWLGLASGLKEALQPHPPQLVVGIHGPSAWARHGNPWPRDAQGGLLAEEDQLFDEGVVRALELDGLLQADWLVSPSAAMATWVSDNLLNGHRPEHLLVNRNCPLAQRLQRPERNNTGSPEGLDLVYFGRLEQRKGLALFLEALLKMNTRPQRVLFLGSDCVVGRHSNGEPLWGKELIAQTLQGSGIAVQHEQDLLRDAALQRLLELDAVVVIPSLIENSPCVVEELLDSGLAMVVTDVGGTAELVRAPDRQWLSHADSDDLSRHLDAALRDRQQKSEAYQLGCTLPSWRIQQSWQAFHERLPRLHVEPELESEVPKSQEVEVHTPAAPAKPLWRRAAGKAKRGAGRIRRKLNALVTRR
ncbi:glycosyl transferases group 1 family protein [Synechococcus sp. A15-60]|nr:glycosyl transferases group 1 family protein [Synechococcus sp. A15-60]